MSGSFYTLETKYNSLLGLFNNLTDRVNTFNATLSYQPILADATGGELSASNYAVRVGQYINFGNIVWVQVCIQVNGLTGLNIGTNEIRITLPRVASSTADLTQSLSVSYTAGITKHLNGVSARVLEGSDEISVYHTSDTGSGAGTFEPLHTDEITTAFEINVGGFYFIN